MVRPNHIQIMALFQAYLNSPADSRQPIQEKILRQLASHLDMEKDLLFQKIRSLGSQGRRIVREAGVLDEFGHLDILVSNAAEQHPQGCITKISPEKLEGTFRTNIFWVT